MLQPAELSTLVAVLLIFPIFFRIFRKNIIGEFIAGVVLGIFFEIATEPVWDYHLTWYLYKDVSPIIMLGWGVSFTILVKLSDWFYKKVYHKKQVNLFDLRLFASDLIVGTTWLTAVELFGINVLHGWNYSPELGWHIMIPIINFPLEAVLALALFSLVMPTFVRHWQKKLDLIKSKK